MTVKDIDFNRIYKDQDGWYFIPETNGNLHRVKWLYIKGKITNTISHWIYSHNEEWVKSWIPTEFTKDEIAEFRLWISL